MLIKNMEVKDFMITYPNYGPDFEGEIFRLKEFNKEKLTLVFLFACTMLML